MYKKRFVFLGILFLSLPIYALVVGSNALPQQITTSPLFPDTDTDNEIRGFTQLENGFELGFDTDLTATCSYNAFQTIRGEVFLMGGLVNLEQDIVFSDATLQTGGVFAGNDHSITFISTDTIVLPVKINVGVDNNVLVPVVGDTDPTDPVYSVDWSPDDQYVCAGYDTGQIIVYEFLNETSLVQRATANMGTGLNDVRWHPSLNYIVATGDTTGGTNEIQVYYFDSISPALTVTATANPNSNVVSGVWHPDGSYILTNMTGTNTQASVYPFSSAAGLSAPISYTFASGATFERHTVDWSGTGTCFAVSSNLATLASLDIFGFDGSTISFRASVTVDQYNVNALDWSASCNYISLSARDLLTPFSDYVLLFEYDPILNTLESVPSGDILTGDQRDSLAVQWNNVIEPAHVCIGRNIGPGQQGTEFRVYRFDDSNQTFTLVAEREVTNPVYSVRWSHDDRFIARGAEDDDTPPSTDWRVGIFRGLDPVSSTLTFEDTRLSVDSNILVNGIVQFAGVDVFNGNNYIVDFSSTGSIVINSYVIFENMTIKGIRDSIISLDSTSTLALRNVCWIQDDDFVFDQGAIDIIGDVLIAGAGSFIFQSDKPITIYDNAKLMFDAGMIFNYDAVVENLLQFESDLATLYLKETTVTCTNLQLTKGTVVLEGSCPLENFAASESEGLQLGDGSSSINDVNVKILPESGFDIKSGFLVNKNVT